MVCFLHAAVEAQHVPEQAGICSYPPSLNIYIKLELVGSRKQRRMKFDY
jgi:hypothetical protein